MSARVTRKIPLHESIFKLNEKLNMLMSEMKKLRYAVLQGQAQGQQAPLQQEQVQEGEQIQPIEEAPVLARGPGRRSDWHYWGANWAAKNPDIPRDANFSLKMAEAYRAWKDAHPGQTYLDFRGTDVIDGRKRLTQKKGKKVGSPRQVTPPSRQATPPLAPAPLPIRQATPPPLAPLREPTPPPRQATPPPPAPLREPTPPPRQATPPPSRQKTPNRYSQPSPGPLSTPSLLQGRRETPPQEYYEPAEEQEFSPEEEEQVEEEQVEEPVRVPIQEESVEESPEQEVAQEEEAAQEEQLSPEEEVAIEAAQEEQLQEEEQPEASPEWPEKEEQAEEGDLEIVTIGQQEYFRTSNNGLFTVIRDDKGNPDIGPWAGRLSDDGTQVVETEQPEEP